MKTPRLLIIILIGIAMASCHSQKGSVRGGASSGKGKPVALHGKADNKYTQELMAEAYSWLGTPYKYGGVSKKGADCSGFVMSIYKKSLDIDLPRVSREQGDYCRKISKKDLFPGDLVFFATSKGRVNHVGLYIGDNKILHASSSQGVVVSDLSVKYFTRHFHHAGMVPAYRDKVSAYISSSGPGGITDKSGNMPKAKKNKKDADKDKRKKKGSQKEVSPKSGAVPVGAVEIPMSELFKSKDKYEKQKTLPQSKQPLPPVPPADTDSMLEIQADTVQLMVLLAK